MRLIKGTQLTKKIIMLQHRRKAKRLAIKRISDYRLSLIHKMDNVGDRELAEELVLGLQRLLEKMRKELIK